MRASLIDAVFGDGEAEGSHDRRDVLVETLGHLVAAEDVAGIELWDEKAGDELARRAVLLAVVDEELLDRHGADALALAQLQGRAERDQCRRRVADRRAVGDVADDRAARPHLLGAEAAEEFAEIGIDASRKCGSAWA